MLDSYNDVPRLLRPIHIFLLLHIFVNVFYIHSLLSFSLTHSQPLFRPLLLTND